MFACLQVYIQMENHYSLTDKIAAYKEYTLDAKI